MAQYDTAAKWSDLSIKLNFLGRQKLLPLKINDLDKKLCRKCECVCVCDRGGIRSICIHVYVVQEMNDTTAGV